MDKIREEFEKWASSHHGVYALGKVDGNYSNQKVNDDWLVWQASRATLVVNTSELRSADYYVTGTVYLGDVEDALDKAGIKYE